MPPLLSRQWSCTTRTRTTAKSSNLARALRLIAFAVGPWLTCKLTFGFQGREPPNEPTLTPPPCQSLYPAANLSAGLLIFCDLDLTVLEFYDVSTDISLQACQLRLLRWYPRLISLRRDTLPCLSFTWRPRLTFARPISSRNSR
jgi:hypothetical protein